MKELNARLKSGRIDSLYVFWGAERFLIRNSEEKLAQAIFGDNGAFAEMNTTTLQGDGCKPDDVFLAAETLPFGSEKRLIKLIDSGLLQTGRKDASDTLAEYLQNLPDYAVIAFIEYSKAPDARGKLYKRIAAHPAGLVTEFKTPEERELSRWLMRFCASEGVAMPGHVADMMLRHVGSFEGEGVMDRLYTEARKLIAFLDGQGEAGASHVEAICTQSFEGKVFSLVKEIGYKNPRAVVSLDALLAMKEQPLRILHMIARQYRMMLICKGLRAKGASPGEISQKAGLRDFMVRDFLSQSDNFTEDGLVEALSDCLKAETDIKTGKMADRLAVEMLILKHCGSV